MVRRLTVLQMLPELNGGGVERGTLEVAAALVQAGHRSLVMSAGGRMVESLVAQGSEHVAWPVQRKSLWTLRLVRPLRRFLREQQVDVVHARSRVPAWVAWLAWRGMPPGRRPRFVTTVHGLYSVNAYSRIMTRGERVIAVSQTACDYIRDNYPDVESGSVQVIPRGIDAEAFPPGYQPSASWLDAWSGEYPQLRGCRVLTLPGRITRLKGHHDFIELVGRLREHGQAVHGLVVGGEDARRRAYAEELYREVEQRGLEDSLTFTGQRQDMREIYAVSDIVYSLSTKPESFGRTVLEALSLGRPVIGYDHGGVGEILAQCYPNGRVPMRGADELVARTLAMLQRPETVPDCASRFALQSMLDDTLALYAALAEGEQ
ncbi:MAG: glycosyltransferase family 4 protein [Gammaproteobacteria bacterium]|nr:glycosyltransferase family 4 protein [Gammaproteobacteria bacterium]